MIIYLQVIEGKIIMKKRISLALVCCLLLTLLPTQAMAYVNEYGDMFDGIVAFEFPALGATVEYTGTIGAGGAPWRLYSDGTLIVNPGHVHWNGGTASPWDAHRDDIKRIIFDGLGDEKPFTAGPRLRNLFTGLSNMQTIAGLELFDTSDVIYMNSTFRDTSSLTYIGDISGWDVSNVENMSAMFFNASSLTELDLSSWDTGSVTTMSYMFRGTSDLTCIGNVSGWDTSNVNNLERMFLYADSLTELDLSGWKTDSVTNMRDIFRGASSLVKLDLSGWDTSNVTNMSGMFLNASNLENIYGLSGWNTNEVTTMSFMFSGASSLAMLDLSDWVVSNVNNMDAMFRDTGSLVELDLSGWDTSNVTNMGRMFQHASGLVKLNLSGWDTGSVTIMSSMFTGTASLRELTLGEYFSFLTNAALQAVPATGGYAGRWRNIDTNTTATSAELMAKDDATIAGTWVWQRNLAINLDVDGETFPPAVVGYNSSILLRNVTVRNVGAEPTGDLTVTLSGNNASDFEISITLLDSIPLNGITSFTVMPKPGLPAGTHTAIVTVSGNGGISESFTINFTVTSAGQINLAISLKVDGETFPSAEEGYNPSTLLRNVTVHNIGTGPTGNLTIMLSGNNASDFEISVTSLNSIALSGTAIFTVVPRSGLSAGTHTATITVSGSGGISESFTISFTVTPAQGSGTSQNGGGGGTGSWHPPEDSPPENNPPTEEPPDIPADYEPVDYEIHFAFMFGDDHGNFRPLSNITRAEAATVLTRTQLTNFTSPDNLPAGMDEFNIFSDVKPGQWHYYYIAWAYHAGLVAGEPANLDGNRKFRPDDPITRQEFAAIVARTDEIRQSGYFMYFNDWNQINDWAQDYVYTALLTGWMIGRPPSYENTDYMVTAYPFDSGNSFRPLDNISRAEVATTVNRTLNRVDGWPAFRVIYLRNPSAVRYFPDVGDGWYFPSIVAATNNHHLGRSVLGYIIWMEIF